MDCFFEKRIAIAVIDIGQYDKLHPGTLILAK